jgi:cytochrome P450
MQPPVFATDIYADTVIVNPYPIYREMRDTAPLLQLSAHGIYAIPRFAEVRRSLLDHRQLSSAQGVAGFRWPPEIDVQNSLASDEPMHSRFRKALDSPLQPNAVLELAEAFKTAAADLVDRLSGAGTFDLMEDFARILPVSIVSSLVGLPERGREKMLDWAAAAFDVLGVNNDRTRAAFAEASAMVNYVRTECHPDTVKPGGWAARIWDAVDRGELTPQEAGILHIDLLAPSLDTTIFATGHLVHQLAINPGQWAKLKADHALIPAAIEEAVRLESPIRAFARVATCDVDFDGFTLPEGERVLVMYASGNRDERRWDDPDTFRIDRPGLGAQLGFGQGRHACAGMHLARMEMRSLLKAMVERVDRIEVGEPTYALNNVLRGFATLPVRFVK